MSTTLHDRAASRLPERADRSAKAALRKAEHGRAGDLRKADVDAKADLRREEQRVARRTVLGEVLQTALVILRHTRLQQQADFIAKGLGRERLDERQLARWLNGTEPAPWEELLTITELQFPLCQALFESCQADLVDIETTIRRRQPRKVVA